MIRARDRIALERVSMEFPTVAGPLRVVEDVSYRIREIVTVPFGHPREQSLHETHEFGELRSHVRDLVMKEYAAQAQQATRQS